MSAYNLSRHKFTPAKKIFNLQTDDAALNKCQSLSENFSFLLQLFSTFSTQESIKLSLKIFFTSFSPTF
jgi:hypothetical protein